jgi:cyclophilin family peptidyl-prolyl cis-trans isomerase
MIQGGDPNSKDDNPNKDGMGGPGYTIDAEFNDIKHTKGILSMARSQTLILLARSSSLCMEILHGSMVNIQYLEKLFMA